MSDVPPEIPPSVRLQLESDMHLIEMLTRQRDAETLRAKTAEAREAALREALERTIERLTLDYDYEQLSLAGASLVRDEIERATAILAQPDLRDLDECRCGDFRRDHLGGMGKCRMPNDLAHGFKPCERFRLHRKAVAFKRGVVTYE